MLFTVTFARCSTTMKNKPPPTTPVEQSQAVPVRRYRSLLLAAWLLLPTASFEPSAAPLSLFTGTSTTSVPLAPDYVIGPDGSVMLRICYNWSCSRTEVMTFSAEELAEVSRQLALCTGNTLLERLQRLRIGIWQMELLAAKHQPLLFNDLAVNDLDYELDGRTDCIDNTTNTDTFLNILLDLGLLPGWSPAPPRVRDRFTLHLVHWTAIVVDRQSGRPWSVDSWFRPHGHLPIVSPLNDWLAGNRGWEGPLQRFNRNPVSSDLLCATALSQTGLDSGHR